VKERRGEGKGKMRDPTRFREKLTPLNFRHLNRPIQLQHRQFCGSVLPSAVFWRFLDVLEYI